MYVLKSMCKSVQVLFNKRYKYTKGLYTKVPTETVLVH